MSTTIRSKLKKLGEGSFGCVVSHPLRCSEKEEVITKKNRDASNQVGKLFYDKRDYKGEVRLSKLVRKIDPSETKLLVPTSACAVSKRTMEKPENVNAIMRCEKITNKGSEYQYYSNTDRSTIPNKVWQIKMPYAGSDIDKAIEKYKNGISVKSFLKMLVPLFEALVLLKNSKMVHQDIKISNVLVYNRKACLIDFSLMLPFKDIYTRNNYYRLKRKYRPFPPEYHLASLVMKYEGEIRGKKYTLDTITMDLLDKYKHHLDKLSHYYEPFYTSKEVINIAGHDTLLPMIIKSMDSMQQFADKIDIYSVGTLMAEISSLYINQPLKDKKYVEFVCGILHPDPRLRTSPEDALEQCKILSQ